MGLRIGVDIDGVLADHLPPRCARFHAWYGYKVTPSEILDVNEPLGGTGISMEDHVKMLYAIDTGHFLDMRVIPGARTSLNHLQDAGHELILISHRTDDIHDITADWAAEHRVPYDELYVGAPPDKTQLVDIDVLIDDSVSNVNRAAASGGEGVLFCRHYNEHEMRSLLDDVRLPDSDLSTLHKDLAQQWRDIEKLIAELANELDD